MVKQMFADLDLYFIVNDLRYFITHRKSIAEKIINEGGSVTVVYIRSSCQKEPIINDKIVFLPLLSIKFFEHFFRCIKKQFNRQKNRRVSIFHVITLGSIFITAPFLLFMERERIVWSIAGLGDLFNKGSGLKKYFRNIVSSYLALLLKLFKPILIVQNDRDLRYLRRFYEGFRGDIIKTFGSGVPLEEYKRSRESGKLVIYAGRLTASKGVMHFLEAVEKLPEQYKRNWKFCVYGDYKPNNRRNIRKDEFKALSESECVSYQGHTESLNEVLEDTSLLVYPSTYNEGIPRVLIEAGAMCIPCIVYDTPSSREIIIQGENGLLIKRNDINKLSEAIMGVLSDDILRTKLATQSRNVIENKFDVLGVVQKHIQVYAELCKRKRETTHG